MERDCIISYGAAQFLKDRLFEQSDPYQTYACYECGLLAEHARPIDTKVVGMSIRAEKPFCRNCKRSDTVRLIKIPYACKLLIQELMACNLALRLRFEDKIPPYINYEEEEKEEERVEEERKKRIENAEKETIEKQADLLDKKRKRTNQINDNKENDKRKFPSSDYAIETDIKIIEKEINSYEDSFPKKKKEKKSKKSLFSQRMKEKKC